MHENRRLPGSLDQPPRALHYVQRATDVRYLDRVRRKVLELEDVFESGQKEGRLDALLEKLTVAILDRSDADKMREEVQKEALLD